jgi:hypothetical protein
MGCCRLLPIDDAQYLIYSLFTLAADQEMRNCEGFGITIDEDLPLMVLKPLRDEYFTWFGFIFLFGFKIHFIIWWSFSFLRCLFLFPFFIIVNRC